MYKKDRKNKSPAIVYRFSTKQLAESGTWRVSYICNNNFYCCCNFFSFRRKTDVFYAVFYGGFARLIFRVNCLMRFTSFSAAVSNVVFSGRYERSGPGVGGRWAAGRKGGRQKRWKQKERRNVTWITLTRQMSSAPVFSEFERFIVAVRGNTEEEAVANGNRNGFVVGGRVLRNCRWRWREESD